MLKFLFELFIAKKYKLTKKAKEIEQFSVFFMFDLLTLILTANFDFSRWHSI